MVVMLSVSVVGEGVCCLLIRRPGFLFWVIWDFEGLSSSGVPGVLCLGLGFWCLGLLVDLWGLVGDTCR